MGHSVAGRIESVKDLNFLIGESNPQPFSLQDNASTSSAISMMWGLIKYKYKFKVLSLYNFVLSNTTTDVRGVT